MIAEIIDEKKKPFELQFPCLMQDARGNVFLFAYNDNQNKNGERTLSSIQLTSDEDERTQDIGNITYYGSDSVFLHMIRVNFTHFDQTLTLKND